MQAAEEALATQSDKLRVAMQEKGSLEAKLQRSQLQLAAPQAAATAAGQQKDGDLQTLVAQLKVECTTISTKMQLA